jgi:hypothetical protein
MMITECTSYIMYHGRTSTDVVFGICSLIHLILTQYHLIYPIRDTSVCMMQWQFGRLSRTIDVILEIAGLRPFLEIVLIKHIS